MMTPGFDGATIGDQSLTCEYKGEIFKNSSSQDPQGQKSWNLNESFLI